jgi:hypothetical protein
MSKKLLIFFSSFFILSCTDSGSQSSSENKLLDNQIQEKNFCMLASKTTYEKTIQTYSEGSIYPTGEYVVIEKGFNLAFNESNWFNLPSGDLKDLAKDLNFLKPQDASFFIDVKKYSDAIKYICLDRYGIDIDPVD